MKLVPSHCFLTPIWENGSREISNLYVECVQNILSSCGMPYNLFHNQYESNKDARISKMTKSFIRMDSNIKFTEITYIYPDEIDHLLRNSSETNTRAVRMFSGDYLLKLCSDFGVKTPVNLKNYHNNIFFGFYVPACDDETLFNMYICLANDDSVAKLQSKKMNLYLISFFHRYKDFHSLRSVAEEISPIDTLYYAKDELSPILQNANGKLGMSFVNLNDDILTFVAFKIEKLDGLIGKIFFKETAEEIKDHYIFKFGHRINREFLQRSQIVSLGNMSLMSVMQYEHEF
uniref:Uncharacterized protein n=1 Tax=Magnetococcus massalia (strain MO-1) TaxID=451514 RepID=A0A1S7LKI4_MAGMO|nr:Protein of unknown function [Candidatus Magnetococcus massalia]